MRTMIQPCLIVATLLAFDSTSVADQKSHRQAAEATLKALQIDKQLQIAIDQTLDLQVKANPQIAPYKDAMRRFFAKYMSYESLREDLITIYADAFTEQELKQLTAFYQTPTGRKMVEKMPELMSKGMQLGVSRVQENQEELKRMLQEERDKTQKSQ